MKQYMPMKPNKWGFKLFVLAGVSGFAYNFEIYSGQENDADRPNGEPDLGATSNIVLRLSRIVPRSQNYKLYHDNYYTAIPLMVHLAKEGIYSLGTVRRNRLPNCKLPSEASMKKEERGKSIEYVTTVDNVDISSLIWKDNKYVTLISSFAGTQPETSLKRYDRKLKKTIDVKCPNVIKEYNRHMGGVDLLDSLMGRYKIKVKSRKWYIRMFYHLLDLTMVNAWLAYKRVLKQNGSQDSDILKQVDFRAEVAECLCKIETSAPKRGRPSTVEQQIKAKKKKGPAQTLPPQEVRQDKYGHWPVTLESKMRCKFPNCKGFTRIKCDKCGVALCLNKSNNCFKNFHIN
ncbi:piggyBac transposable element-derived protein 3-like [Calliphora vicina]|uniref:piggyBac transposable element-derived protein 3-like n=1 Tax=Calliphora vicina TaxID=7373 RepID=UPI00325BE60F